MRRLIKFTPRVDFQHPQSFHQPAVYRNQQQITGQPDGRPDELSIKYGQGVDVFVTECQTDYARLNRLKYGFPEWLTNYTIDLHHTPHYAVGYMMKQVNPRIGMVTHMEYDEPTVNETIAGIRAHWDGLFAFGAPDGVIVNVTKEAIWVRNAALPEDTGMSVPDLASLLGADETGKIVMPNPRIPREEQQEQLTRELEIDPKKYYPEDVYREPLIKLPDPLEMHLPVKKKED